MKKKLRVLQVGCGGISHNWLTTLSSREDVEIVGLTDLHESNAQDKKKNALILPVIHMRILKKLSKLLTQTLLSIIPYLKSIMKL